MKKVRIDEKPAPGGAVQRKPARYTLRIDTFGGAPLLEDAPGSR